ncbi:MAG: SAM-dependent methyltransferase [Lachnospiraceae bacterium]|nr:SAM-dependent methyltransferase [Lachnospiraceae bacterium]
MKDELKDCFAQMFDAGVRKIVISKRSSKQEAYKNITVEKKRDYYQIARYTEKQVFHENVGSDRITECCAAAMDGHFQQANGWTLDSEYILLRSKKGACTFKRKKLSDRDETVGNTDWNASSADLTDHKKEVRETEKHNREKNYILKEGCVIEPLVDMGIFTPEGRIIRSMYDKYKQINRFLEIIDDEIRNWKKDSIRVIDFGCGKSYLTFVLYYYLVKIRGMQAEIIGLDLKEDVIKKCGQSAKEYGYDGLRFEVGDINGYQPPFDVDMVISLHACDTATDYALYNAVSWKARLIFSVPCCQHELNRQIQTENLKILTRYGIIKERFSALATDAIRGNLLEYCGYRTQLLEFIDFEHTPKNILIRAVRRDIVPKKIRENALDEVKALMKEFSVRPTLYRLLVPQEDGMD